MYDWSLPLATAADWVLAPLTSSSPTDLLRLAAVPAFGWAAYRDVRTRRIPNKAWLPLAVLGVALLLWDVWTLSGPDLNRELFYLRVALSLGMVAPIGYLFYWIGGFGGADAKALIVLAVLFPTFPTYYFPTVAIPLTVTTVGVFSLTILSNTVLAGAIYPLAITARNGLRGHVSRAMFIGRPIDATDATDEYGSLLETPEGFTRRGLDLDALRMYLQWRGLTLAELRADPERYRDPATVPEEPNPPGDGSISPASGPEAETAETDAAADPAEGVGDGPATDGGRKAYDDPWGAEAFLDEIEGSAYGTTAEDLRDGLDVLAAEETVWISPGTPFLVPMFAGLVLSLTYGDLFVKLVSMVV